MVSVWRREASVRTSKGDCERSKNRGEAVGKELVCWAADTDEDATGLGKSLGNVLSSWAGVGGIANRYAGGGKVWAEKKNRELCMSWAFTEPYFLPLSSLYLL